MSDYYHAQYASCDKCYRVMHGINKPTLRNKSEKELARTVCEPCGGNTTEYHAGKPFPKLLDGNV